MDEILGILKDVGVPTITAVVSWLLAKRKYNAEVDNNVISNMGEAFTFYQKVIEDNKTRIEDSQKKIDELIEENYSLKNELHALKIQVSFLMKYNCMKAGCKNRVTNSNDIRDNDDDVNENTSK
jgi:regulator of replication initiation timing